MALHPELDPAESEEMVLARRAEQQRIAQLLHDTLSQSLTAAYLQATVISQKLKRDGSDVTSDVDRLAGMLYQMVAEFREVTQQVLPEGEPPSATTMSVTDKISAG